MLQREQSEVKLAIELGKLELPPGITLTLFI